MAMFCISFVNFLSFSLKKKAINLYFRYYDFAKLLGCRYLPCHLVPTLLQLIILFCSKIALYAS